MQQAGLAFGDRQRNVDGAFAPTPLASRKIDGIGDREIYLVDDVLTTGATLDACAQVLRSLGLRNIHAVTLARA
jgi:predicted amidophosphoribosyltransferase